MKAAILALCLALPAHAAVLGVVNDPNGRLDLYSEAGRCLGQAKRAEFVPAVGTAIPGCWIHTPRGVLVLFWDGDIADIPAKAIKPATPA